MVVALAELVLVVLLVGLLVLGGWAAWTALRGAGPGRLPPRDPGN